MSYSKRLKKHHCDDSDFGDMDDDALHTIMLFVNTPRDALYIMLVCKRWYTVLNDNEFWAVVEKKIFRINRTNFSKVPSHRQRYLERIKLWNKFSRNINVTKHGYEYRIMCTDWDLLYDEVTSCKKNLELQIATAKSLEQSVVSAHKDKFNTVRQIYYITDLRSQQRLNIVWFSLDGERHEFVFNNAEEQSLKFYCGDRMITHETEPPDCDGLNYELYLLFSKIGNTMTFTDHDKHDYLCQDLLSRNWYFALHQYLVLKVLFSFANLDLLTYLEYHPYYLPMLLNQSVYNGDLLNGRPHGNGVLQCKNGSNYQGEFKDGLPHGRGILRYFNNDRYEGEFEYGRKNGIGKLQYNEGGYYEGGFKDGQFKGKGVLKFKAGGEYEGNFENGVLHGFGIARYNTSASYEGQFFDGTRQGHGVLRMTNGDVYEGEFLQNTINGQGVMRYHNGDVYVGKFDDGQPYRGVLTKSSDQK